VLRLRCHSNVLISDEQMGTWRASFVLVLACFYTQEGLCGSLIFQNDIFTRLGPVQPQYKRAGRSVRETLFGPRRSVLGGLQQCSSSVFACQNGQNIRSDAYDSIVRGPCAPIPGLDLVRCSTLLTSKAVIESVVAGVCELKCREFGSSIPCSASAAPPSTYILQGKANSTTTMASTSPSLPLVNYFLQAWLTSTSDLR
jgi:hypothetical protein